MNRSTDATHGLDLRDWRNFTPSLLVVAALFAVGMLGLQQPLAWLVVGPVVIVGTALVAMRLPLLLFWLVPVGMCWYVPLKVLHYEALVIVLALLIVLDRLHGFELRKLVLEPLETRYLLFLAALLPGFFVAVNQQRFFGGFKIFFLGLFAFEVARRGAWRFGRSAMLWGPLLFVAGTTAMLVVRTAQSGVPSAKVTLLRTYLTRLTWGSSNYVAAALVLCMPALVLLIRLLPPRTWRRLAVSGVLVASLVAPLLGASRGGFLLGVAYLLSLLGLVRRSFALIAMIALGTAGILGALLLTPFGQGLVLRFTDPRNMDSIAARVWIWQAAWERGVAHWPFGVGAGQATLIADSLNIADPHNFLLTLFSELGIAALVLWLWMFAALWRAAPAPGAEAQPPREALRATLCIAFFNMLFEPTLSGNLYHLLFWWLIGIFASTPASPQTARSPHE